MKFIDMCEDILNSKHRCAYRKSYPNLTTNVRLGGDFQKNNVFLFYAEVDRPKVPLGIDIETLNSDDWVVTDDIHTRLNIANFMEMPDAKCFLNELADLLLDKDWKKKINNFLSEGDHAFRMGEAVALDILRYSPDGKDLYFSEIGINLLKTL